MALHQKWQAIMKRLEFSETIACCFMHFIEAIGLDICLFAGIGFDFHFIHHPPHLQDSFDYFHSLRELTKEIGLDSIQVASYHTEDLLAWVEAKAINFDSVADSTASINNSKTSHTDSVEPGC